jgi:holliday junction DNA helicase RuvB
MAIERKGAGRPPLPNTAVTPPPIGLQQVATPKPQRSALINPKASTVGEMTESSDHRSASYALEDPTAEQTIRPKTLHDYIGQQALKQSLSISLQAAKHRHEPLDHLLFYGPPGLGKTTLAMAMANAMGATLHTTSAPALERPRDIIGLLMALQDPTTADGDPQSHYGGDILFIDEIHRLNTVSEEILYSAMEDFTLDHTVGKGQSAKTIRIPLPKFTLIGATTKAGALSNPLRDRFGMLYRLNFYTHDELALIVSRSATILNLSLTTDAAMVIASRSRGTPRIANRLLRRVRDFAVACGQTPLDKLDSHTPIDVALAEAALSLYEIDSQGLDPTDRALLTQLIDGFAGGPVGLDTLASTLGEDARTLEDVVEPYLLQIGLIARTPRGRTATAKTYLHLGRPLPSLAQLG